MATVGQFGTTKSKNFGGTVIPQGAPPIELSIYDQTFRARGSMSGLKLMKAMSAMQGNDEDVDPTEVLVDFLASAFLTEDRERAMAFLENSEPPVEFPLIQEIVQWLVEVYTGNPTESHSSSTPTSPTNGATSSAAPSEPAQTSAVLTDTNSGPSQQPQPSTQL